MSAGQISPAYVAEFDARVKQAYQSMAVLNETVRTKTGVIGSTHRFTKIGKGIATPHTNHAPLTPMAVDYSTATAVLEDFDAADWSDIFQRQKVNFDETRELVMVTAGALGRRKDQITIDALDASGTVNTVAVGIGGDNAFNMGKLRRIGKLMNEKGVPSTDRHLALSATALEQLFGTTQASSSDFNSVKALVSGEMDSYYGFKFHMIDDRDEGGLPIAGNNRTLFAWHKDAVGVAIGIDMKTEINYVPLHKSYLIAGSMSLGGIAIDPIGIVSATIDESVSI